MNKMLPLWEISPAEAKARLNDCNKTVLVDVREPEECAVARLGTAEYIPMSLVPAAFQRLEGMAGEGDLLVLCHHGVRSLQVVAWLRERGLDNCYSVAGGIDRWSREIDPAIPRY
jgi:rhodanese-related sulfurtransferase